MEALSWLCTLWFGLSLVFVLTVSAWQIAWLLL